MKKRWITAQEREKDFWKLHRKLKPSTRPEYDLYIEFIEKYLPLSNNSKTLEIGCGPETMVERMKGRLYGIDPLMAYFLSEYNMNKKVKWQEGSAEKLPYKQNFFDLVIIGNVLDHCDEPLRVLEESQRCLKLGGGLFLVQNCYSKPLVKFKNLMERIGLGDDCHPHSFTIQDILRLLNKNNFKMINQRALFQVNSSQELESTTRKIKRLYKEKGLGYLIKHAIIKILSYIPEHVFKTYSLEIFLARKVAK